MVDMWRNPELMREMVRTTDRAMSNIEASPEGYNMLRRMYENVQEPLMTAATAPGTNQTPSATNTGGTAAAGGTEPNAAPLPNPWTPSTGNSCL